MDFFSVLTLLGGLALFLYGMETMGSGLARLSGGKLERILERLTDSPLKAVLLGAGVTAVIQSSSATTVMAVGFVNSGMMQLQQAVGIIMGANVGTTVTSWILSLAGIESSNFFIRICHPDDRDGYDERGRQAVGRGSRVCQYLNNVFQSDPGDALRRDPDSGTSEFFRLYRYPAGVVCHRGCDISDSASYCDGTEYRYLRDCPALRDWGA